MRYRVTLTSRAELQLYQSALWWSENRDPEQAVRWLGGTHKIGREKTQDG